MEQQADAHRKLLQLESVQELDPLVLEHVVRAVRTNELGWLVRFVENYHGVTPASETHFLTYVGKGYKGVLLKRCEQDGIQLTGPDGQAYLVWPDSTASEHTQRAVKAQLQQMLRKLGLAFTWWNRRKRYGDLLPVMLRKGILPEDPFTREREDAEMYRAAERVYDEDVEREAPTPEQLQEFNEALRRLNESMRLPDDRGALREQRRREKLAAEKERTEKMREDFRKKYPGLTR